MRRLFPYALAPALLLLPLRAGADIPGPPPISPEEMGDCLIEKQKRPGESELRYVLHDLTGEIHRFILLRVGRSLPHPSIDCSRGRPIRLSCRLRLLARDC